jgi:hypothetical protein
MKIRCWGTHGSIATPGPGTTWRPSASVFLRVLVKSYRVEVSVTCGDDVLAKRSLAREVSPG